MNKKKLNLPALLLVILLATTLALSGCNTGSEEAKNPQNDATQETKGEDNSAKAKEKPKLEFAHVWTGGDAKAPFYEPAVDKYVKANEGNVEITVTAVSGHQFQDIMKVRMAADELPDLFNHWPGEGNLKPFVDADKLVTVDEFINNSNCKIRKEMFDASMFDDCKVDGVAYAFPLEQFKGFWLANKELFDKYNLEVPKTVADLKEVSKVFVENGIVPINMGSKGGNPGHLMYNAFSYQFAGGLEDALNLPQTYKFNTEANLKAAKLIDEMRQLKMFPEDTIANGDWGPAVALYNEKKAAMVYCFPWKIGDVDPEVAANSVFFDIPAIADAAVDPTGFAIGARSMAHLINKDSFNDADKKEELVKFADYILSDEMYNVLAQTGNMPAKKVEIDGEGLNPLFVGAVEFTSQQENAYPPMWNVIPDPEIHTTYIEKLDELFAGIITPEQFVEQVQKAFDEKKK